MSVLHSVTSTLCINLSLFVVIVTKVKVNMATSSQNSDFFGKLSSPNPTTVSKTQGVVATSDK